MKIAQSILFILLIAIGTNAQSKRIGIKDSVENKILDSLNTNENFIKTEIDSILKVEPQTDTVKTIDKAKRAARLSAILPGAGQVYNKQIYKAPIYPGIIVLGIANGINSQRRFNNFKTELSNSLDASERANLRIEMERARNVANLSYTAAVLSYSFNITDAYFMSKIRERQGKHSALRAGFRSARVPGWGQFYNRQGWKSVIIYGGFIGTGYFIARNFEQKNCFKNLYLNRVRYNYVDEDLVFKCIPENENFDSQLEFFSQISDEQLLDNKQYFDELFQWSIIGFAAIYALNIIDATVYGHLFDFDEIDKDINIAFRPVINQPIANTRFTGFSLNITL